MCSRIAYDKCLDVMAIQYGFTSKLCHNINLWPKQTIKYSLTSHNVNNYKIWLKFPLSISFIYVIITSNYYFIDPKISFHLYFILLYNFIFFQKLSQLADWINLVPLSPSLESHNTATLSMYSWSANVDNKLNRYLRSHNETLTAIHFHLFINISLYFFYSWFISKANAASLQFDGILAGLATPSASPKPNAFHSHTISCSNQS